MSLLFLKNSLIYFNWRLMTLQYCSSFCHTLTGISHGYICVSSSWIPLPRLSSSHTFGLSQRPALGALLYALNLHWSSILHMVIYIFQCYSLKSSHPRLLPQSPKVCSLHLYLFCCLTYRVIVNHLTKFHIYALIYCIGVFLSDLLHSV